MKLALETSNRQASLLLEKNGETLPYEMTQEHRQSSHLLPMVQEHLQNHGVKPEEIQDFYLHVGPGASTGLRMGVAMAQGWAAVFPNVKFYSVHLESMALEVLNEWMPKEAQAYLITDAFAGQIFLQSYLKDAEGYKLDEDLKLLERSALSKLNAQAAIVEDLGAIKKKHNWPKTYTWYEETFPHANWVYKAGLKNSQPCDIATMDVRYLKATSAELNWNARVSK